MDIEKGGGVTTPSPSASNFSLYDRRDSNITKDDNSHRRKQSQYHGFHIKPKLTKCHSDPDIRARDKYWDQIASRVDETQTIEPVRSGSRRPSVTSPIRAGIITHTQIGMIGIDNMNMPSLIGGGGGGSIAGGSIVGGSLLQERLDSMRDGGVSLEGTSHHGSVGSNKNRQGGGVGVGGGRDGRTRSRGLSGNEDMLGRQLSERSVGSENMSVTSDVLQQGNTKGQGQGQGQGGGGDEIEFANQDKSKWQTNLKNVGDKIKDITTKFNFIRLLPKSHNNNNNSGGNNNDSKKAKF